MVGLVKKPCLGEKQKRRGSTRARTGTTCANLDGGSVKAGCSCGIRQNVHRGKTQGHMLEAPDGSPVHRQGERWLSTTSAKRMPGHGSKGGICSGNVRRHPLSAPGLERGVVSPFQEEGSL